jgi:hypothetical protein
VVRAVREALQVALPPRQVQALRQPQRVRLRLVAGRDAVPQVHRQLQM